MAEPGVRFKQDDGSSFPKWKEYTISDLFSKIGAKNINGKNTNVITNSAEFGLIPQRDYFDKDIAVEGRTDNYTVIQTGDFVYNPRKSSYAPMGPFNCYRLEEDGIVSPLYSCLRPKGILNPDYLLWYFQTDKWYGYVNDHGAQNGARHDRVGMTDSILMGIPVTAPCEEEQQKIADFLSSVDEVITASEQEVANLETQKKTVMKKIFSQEVRFKRADGSDFPKWEEKQFLSLIDEIIDFRGRTPKKLGMDWAKGKTDHLALSAINVKKGYIDFNVDPHYGDDALFEKWMSGRELRQGQVLFTTEAPMGNVAQVPDDKPYILSQRTIAFNANANLICDDFLVHLLLAPAVQKRLNELATGGTAQGVSQKSLAKLNVCIPTDIEEQSLIADFLSDFDEAIAAAKKELALWKELKKGLLQQMFV